MRRFFSDRFLFFGGLIIILILFWASFNQAKKGLARSAARLRAEQTEVAER